MLPLPRPPMLWCHAKSKGGQLRLADCREIVHVVRCRAVSRRLLRRRPRRAVRDQADRPRHSTSVASSGHIGLAPNLLAALAKPLPDRWTAGHAVTG